MKVVSYARALTAGALTILAVSMPGAAEQSAVPSGHSVYAFRCSDNEQLRVIFNADQHKAFVARIRRPNVTLDQADATEGYRFTRGDHYELTGNLEEIHWRVGSAEPVVCHRGER
ncbi:MAG: hypothetical protein QM759_14990 [Terricaulis sp.]